MSFLAIEPSSMASKALLNSVHAAVAMEDNTNEQIVVRTALVTSVVELALMAVLMSG